MREAMRLAQLSRRFRRCPAMSSGGEAGASRATSQRRGMSEGSFWPSPSRVAIQGLRAALTPVRMAARSPWIATLDGDGQNDPSDIPRLWTSDAADDLLCVDLGGRRILKKKK